jgi:hypothetical protein
MLLTGKALIDFDEWLIEYYLKNRQDYNQFSNGSILRKHYRKTEVEKNALIIEWFIYRQLLQNVFYKEYRHTGFSDYTFAINQSIKKCNEIYNNLNTKKNEK